MSYIKAIFWQIELTVPKDRAHEVEEGLKLGCGDLALAHAGKSPTRAS